MHVDDFSHIALHKIHKLLNILIYHPDFNDLDKKNEMNEKNNRCGN